MITLNALLVIILVVLVGGGIGGALVWVVIQNQGPYLPPGRRNGSPATRSSIPQPPPPPTPPTAVQSPPISLLPAVPKHSSGALIPWSDPAWTPPDDLETHTLVNGNKRSLTIRDDRLGELGPTLTITARLTESDITLPDPDTLPVVTGPVIRAFETLVGNTRLMDWLMRKGGFALVEMPAGTKWMTANGRQVAQAIGEAGKAGARAPVVAVAGTAAILAPQLLTVAAALGAEYVLSMRIEHIRKIATLIHQRQVNEVLAVGDVGRSLVQRARALSDDPRDYPEILVHDLVRVGEALNVQIQASRRMRRSVLGRIDGEGTKQPKNPESGDQAEAQLELIAGYELHVSAAQVAAIRVEHALAHGDHATAEYLLAELAGHLDALQQHHAHLGALDDMQHRRFGRKWADTVHEIAQSYEPLVEQVASPRQFSLSIGEPGGVELRVLPPTANRATKSVARSRGSPT